MSDAMFSIDLDVSRALAAQQKLLDGWDKIASRSADVGKVMQPLKQGFDDADKSVTNLTQKSLSNLEKQLNSVLRVSKDMKDKLCFSNKDLVGFSALESNLQRVQVGVRNLRQDLAKDITPKFNVQSVAQFEEAIGKVQTRLKNLEYVKAKMNPVDYASFKASYEQALAGYQAALKNTIEKSTAFNSKNKGMFDYLNTGSYQMMGFAGKQQVSSGITSGLNDALQGMRGFNTEAVKVQSSLDYINKKVTESQNKLNGFSLVVKRVFEYGLVYRFQNALLSLPGAFYEMNSAMEKFAASYRGIFGESAAAKMEYVKDAANKYGMDIISIADSYKKFSVTLDELGVAGSTTDKIFESFTEGLKKAGATSTDSENAFRALIQMYSKGVVSAEEFTRQLSQYIPAANAMAARSLGVTTAEFKKMMAAGQVIPDQFIPEFTKQMKIFGLGWEESAKTMESSVSRMKNSLMELADSKAFQEAFSDTTNFISAALKDLGNVFSGGRLAAKGDISFTTWLFGSPEDLDKAIKEYDAKMATLDGKIDALRKKRLQTASNTYMMGSADSTITYDPQVEKDLQAAESEKWTQQLKSALKNVTNEYLELQRKFKEGDLTAEADLNFNKEKMMWLLDTLNKVAGFDGKSWLATIDIDTSSVTAALNAVERLFSATREGRIESANASYESANKRQQTLQQELDSVLASSSGGTAALDMVDRLKQGIHKASIEAQEAKENVVSLVKTASSREVKELGDGIFTGNNAGKDKASQILEAKKEYVSNYNKLMAEYKNSQGTAAAMSPSKFAEVEKKGLAELAGKINQINKQGAGSENAAKRAAIATDKYTESIENLLKKEFALAQDNPLDAAFASIDEKVNSLSHRMEELALKSGTALKDIPAQIAQFKELARGEAVDKQLENLFPWMKHEKEIVVLWDMLGEKWKYASAEAKKHGLAEEELTEKIYNLIAATQQLNKEQKALADADAATNFKDYAKAMQDLDSAKYGEKGSGEKEAIEEFYETYITLTKGMTESRLEMYRRVAEQAKANGMSEEQAAALVQSKWEEAEVQRLEAIQKYGSASEAFSARLAQNFETYKSAATKSRESAVQMADSITNMADSVSSGIGQTFGDLIRNIGNGTASIEDLWKNMLSRMLDAFASFVEELISKQLKSLIAGMLSGNDTTNSLSSAVSSISNIRDGGTGNTGSLGMLGKTIGKGVVSAFSSGDSNSVSFIKQLSNASGIEKLAQASSPSGYTAITSGASAGGALATSTASSSTSMLSTVGSVLGVIGAIGGIVGIVSSLFGGQKEEIKKVASGYNVGYNAGHSTAYGVDFYSDGSVQYAGPSNPDVQKKISDAFRETAESLQDFAEELGFTVDVLEGFSMPNMNVTDDQLDGYIRNGENMMAFKGLMEAGLRGAFDYVARDGEVYVDEYERLSTSLSTVRGGLEAYGYELSDVAMITQNEIDAIRAKNTEVAEGTAQAMQAMAASMGATDDVLAQIARDTPDATAALAATDEQLSSILEADYASDLLDAVGGEDAFNTMMGNLTKNVFDTVEAYAENLTYYNEKATSAIGKLNEAGVTVDNFWERFNEAIKKGLTVDEFEAWGKASTWVNQIDTVTQAMEDWSTAMGSVEQSLEVRKLKALGQDDQASYMDTVYKQEQELAQARKDGYDAAVLLQLEEVQLLELRRAEAELARKGWEAVQDLNVREKRLNNDPYAEAAQAYYDNGWELKEAMESGLYSSQDLARLADIQKREIQKYYDEIAASVEQNAVSAHSRLLRATGSSKVADLYDAQAEKTRTLQDALDSGLYSLAAYADLVAALDAEISNLIRTQEQEEKWTLKEYEARLLAATGAAEQSESITALIAAERELADARQSGYSAAVIAMLEMAQAAELAKRTADNMRQAAADLSSLKARGYEATGDDTNAGWERLMEQQRQERYDALSNGKDQSYMDELMRVQALERTKTWADLQEQAYQKMLSDWREAQQKVIDELNDQLDDLTEKLTDLKDALSKSVDALNEGIDNITTIIGSMLSVNQSIYESAKSAADSLAGTIKDLTYGSESVLSPSQKASSLKGQIDTAWYQLNNSEHGMARVEAAANISQLASQYLEALKKSTNEEDYLQQYAKIMQMLNQADNVVSAEESYQMQVIDALETENRLLELIRKELAKDDPNTDKLKALLEASGIMGDALKGIFEGTDGASSWRTSVESLLSEAGYSDADILAALGGPVGTQAFLAQLVNFNEGIGKTNIQFISKTLGEIKGLEESIQRLTEKIAEEQDKPEPIQPPIDPEPIDKYTAAQIAWAGNLRTAMNDQSYGGKTSWTADDILPNLDFYKTWGNSYGITDTTGYNVPNSMVGEYLRRKTRDLNADNEEGRSNWTALQAKAKIGGWMGYFNGDPNVLAHWLASGHNEGYDFPTTAPIAYKTAMYFKKKWDANPSGTDSPYMLAKLIAGDAGINIPFANDALTLEAIAKKHYDTYIKGKDISKLDPSDRNLVQPYALGGFAGAGTWGLVGEVGPELVRFGSPTSINSTRDTYGIFGDGFDNLAEAIDQMHARLYAVCREVAVNTLRVAKQLDRMEEEGVKVKEA